MRKVAIIHSPPHGEVPFRNIGLIYLQTALLESGFDVKFVDISYEEDKNKTDFYGKIINYLSKKVGHVGDMPDLRLLLGVVFPDDVGFKDNISSIILEKVNEYFSRVKDIADVFIFSNNVLTMYFSCALAKRLKRHGKFTIGGGPTVHFLPFTMFSLFSDVYDYVIIGEGEEIIVKLLRNMDDKGIKDLRGLYYKDGNEIIGSGKYYNCDISKPRVLNFQGIVIKDFIPIIAGRGCPHRCRFCSEVNYWNKYRVRAVEEIINEMVVQSRKYNISNFHFHDDSINANLNWFDRFLHQLTRLNSVCKWESFCTPYGLNERRVEKMKESGCVLLKMGVQSFSENVLRLMGRPTNVEAVINTIKYCVNYGISMHFDLLTCFPGEKREDHEVNLRVLEELYGISDNIYFSPNPFYLSLGSFTALNPLRYNIKIKYYNDQSLPPMPKWISDIIKKSGEFPEKFIYDISEKEVKRRLDDYHRILIKYNKDYLFLGRTY
ncbi:MAG: B12-binding domain-containing radical SAM protein [Deltaproteobacteria bacterium]|nr:B12-binding domain-containing radical SAM protein [Deltaproteobacteria bacterium]